jgi:hypothetical protein
VRFTTQPQLQADRRHAHAHHYGELGRVRTRSDWRSGQIRASVPIQMLLSVWRMGLQGAAAETVDGCQNVVGGLGALLDEALMATISSLTDLWAPRLICFSASSAKKRST